MWRAGGVLCFKAISSPLGSCGSSYFWRRQARVCFGSRNLNELQSTLVYKLLAISSRHKLYTWKSLINFLNQLDPWSSFKTARKCAKKQEQKYKYKTVETLVDKSCGYFSGDVSHQASTRPDFLQILFQPLFRKCAERISTAAH